MGSNTVNLTVNEFGAALVRFFFFNCEEQTFLATEDLRLCLLSFDTEIPFIFYQGRKTYNKKVGGLADCSCSFLRLLFPQSLVI